MKKKLTPEEAQLQSKLNEAEFAFQEKNWAEIESLVSKKGVWAKYGSIVKAGIAFIAIVSSVVALKTVYSEPPKEQTTQTDAATEVDQKLTTEPVEQTNEEKKDLSPNSEETLVEERKAILESSSSEVQEKIQRINTNQITQAEPKVQHPAEKPEVESTSNVENTGKPITLELKYVKLESAPCLNKPLQVRAIFEGDQLPEATQFQWFVNGQKVAGNKVENTILLENVGSVKIQTKAFYGDQFLSDAKTEFVVEEQPNLNFTATDLEDLFYDHNVNLKVNEPRAGSYRWYNNPNERIQFGKETAWTFIEEGTHDLSLEYISPNGCVHLQTQEVVMKKDFVEAFPNTFTPNQDGHNDLFSLTAFEHVALAHFQMEIFNRRGELVFKTNEVTEGWNGKLHNTGDVLPAENYAWVVQVENAQGRKKTFKGKIKSLIY